MKINIAKSSGFCLGVKRAVKIALETAKNQRNVYMLGDIVHNEEVTRQVQKAGIKKIKKLRKVKDGILLIRAHGISLSTTRQAKNLGYRIIDATCPMVKEIHRIAQQMEQKGHKIIIIGDKKHDEVKGITGQLKKKVLVIESGKNMPLSKIKRIKKAAVVVQSTRDLEKVLKIIRVLKKHIKELKFHNTICRPTQIKQEEIKKLPLENDLTVIIGSRTSANTKRLYQIARSLSKKTYWVQSKIELKPGWFKQTRKVGIASGASTPDSTTQAVVDKIRSYR
ncbi:MAG: 4-hydroxy-3-methylbut-2-enyl diphosphate reductase [Candidatus Omnitrophota bacterium]|nr:4-hydroxy-3-methylbut-2-enyl diphosphate reductase [Candidatus Omnitrophota bacterium]